MKISIKDEVKGLSKVYKIVKTVEENKVQIEDKLENSKTFFAEAGRCNYDELSIALGLESRARNAVQHAEKLRQINNELIKRLLTIVDQVLNSAKLKKQDIRRAVETAPEGSKVEEQLLELDSRLDTVIYACASAQQTYSANDNNDSEYGDDE